MHVALYLRRQMAALKLHKTQENQKEPSRNPPSHARQSSSAAACPQDALGELTCCCFPTQTLYFGETNKCPKLTASGAAGGGVDTQE